MSFSKKQQNWILANRKLGSQKIAKKLNLNAEDVQSFLEANPPKSVPKYFYIILILIPFVFLILLELGLQLFNYGEEFKQWVPVTKTTMGLNPEIGRKYFNKTKAIPESIQDTFDKEKKENSFRIFVLGGSSAAGYPFMPLGSFSRYIDQRLKLVYPESKIEVVNISLTAINSYTIRDFIPEVLTQKPDLIIIYAGHNEYYGALGVGSMESLGTSRDMVNLILYLDKYRTTQLVRDFLSWTINLFAGDEDLKSGTLMSRMAEDQSIPLNSETFEKGIEQFKGNMRDVIEMIQNANVNLIVGNLASNLKGQTPFISNAIDSLPSATQIFKDASQKFSDGDYKAANSLYRYAKDLDLLRFRAPEKLNDVIYQLSNEYNFPVANIDSTFMANSPNGIIGDNLMTDHLHPTLEGYQLMGNTIYKIMSEEKYLPVTNASVTNLSKQDSLTVANYYFSPLDSLIAEYKIRVLKNDWPYLKNQGNKKSTDELLQPVNPIDSLAYKFVIDDEPWIEVQQQAANYYLRKGDVESYSNQMDILIYQYSVLPKFYEKAVNELISRNENTAALKFALKKYSYSPDAFSTKWIGIISLSKGNLDEAKKFLHESLGFNAADEQVLYNLAGVYVQEKDYKTALTYSNKAVQINPNYQAAVNLKAQLERAVNSTN